MNLVDVAAIALLVGGIWAGIRSGALPQLGGLGGAIAGGAVAIAVAPLVRDQVETLDGPTRALAVLGGILLLVGLGEAVGSGLGRAASGALGRGILGTVDRVGGGLIGIAQAILIVWLLGGLLAIGPFPTIAAQAQRSTAVRLVSGAMPPIAEVGADIGGLLGASGLPQLFVGLEPIPAPPVALPDGTEAGRIAAAAVASTAEIRSQACGYELSGTGFFVGQGYVATNAHVVAGSERTTVELGGQTARATVVLFDPELDIALLYTPRIRTAVLRFAVAAPARGTLAAALGHPEGGPLAVIPAAVSDVYRAEGLNLYGTASVTRNVIELRAQIEHGDSGGPLVLADGTVGGVVFAEARSDPSVGYALSPTDVAVRIAPSLGRTSPVDTGPCVR